MRVTVGISIAVNNLMFHMQQFGERLLPRLRDKSAYRFSKRDDSVKGLSDTGRKKNTSRSNSSSSSDHLGCIRCGNSGYVQQAFLTQFTKLINVHETDGI